MKHKIPLLQQLFDDIDAGRLSMEGDEIHTFYPTRAHAIKDESVTISNVELLTQYHHYNDNVSSGDLIFWQ